MRAEAQKQIANWNKEENSGGGSTKITFWTPKFWPNLVRQSATDVNMSLNLLTLIQRGSPVTILWLVDKFQLRSCHGFFFFKFWVIAREEFFFHPAMTLLYWCETKYMNMLINYIVGFLENSLSTNLNSICIMFRI